MPFDKNWKSLCIEPNSTINEAIKVLEDSDSKICLVVSKSDSKRHLEGTITDGDIRRAILNGVKVESECYKAMNSNPTKAKEFLSISDLDNNLIEYQLRHLPLVSDSGYLLGLYYAEPTTPESVKNSLFVIMAGGFGSRLKPYTENVPKPMIEVKGKPMLEHIIDKAKLSGFSKFALILHHLPEIIQDYFGDGSAFGISIEYIVEEVPLGTIGGASLLNLADTNYSSIVVTNGDLVSNIDYQDMVKYHIKQNAFATMSVKEHRLVNEFGTVEISGNSITGFKEKPVTISSINAGIYVLSKEAFNLLETGKKKNMPDLFADSVSLGHRVIAYYLYENWNDVGRVADLNKVNGGR